MVHANPRPEAVIATEWTLIAIATVVIAARLNLRLRVQKRRFLNSDYLMCASWVSAIFVAALDIKLSLMGVLDPDVGEDLENYPGNEEETVLAIKILWYSVFPFFTTLYLCKAALLSMYLQIFPAFMQRRRVFLWVVIVYTVLAYVVSILLCICSCLPVRRNWSLEPAQACDEDLGAAVFEVTWALHFLGELLIFALPWMVVTGLQMRVTLKIGVYCTFLLGLINIAFCLSRFIIIMIADSNDSVSFVELWSALDCFIGLIIACLPSLRPYFGSKGGSHYLSNMEEKLKSASEGRTPNDTGVLRGPTASYKDHAAQLADIGDPHLRHYPSFAHSGVEDDLWEARSRSNESDVELVPMSRLNPATKQSGS